MTSVYAHDDISPQPSGLGAEAKIIDRYLRQVLLRRSVLITDITFAIIRSEELRRRIVPVVSGCVLSRLDALQ